MKSLRTHFGVILPMVFLLFSVQFMVFINNVLNDYQKIMKSNYNIILVSNKELLNDDNIKYMRAVERLIPINPNLMLNRLKEQISDGSMTKLKESLPKFYQVKLEFFPNSKELEDIANKLKKIDGVSKVEVFAKAHSSIFNIFLLMQNIIYIFAVLIIILGVILVLKQIKIWLFEHKNRIEIMELFGAPFLFKSSILYKMAFIDSIIATVIVVFFYYFIPENEYFKGAMSELGLKSNTIDLTYDSLVLLGISLALSFFSVTLVMIRAAQETK